jgi:hypothetical protein
MLSLSILQNGGHPLRHNGLVAGAKRTLLIMTLALIVVAVLLASCAPEESVKTETEEKKVVEVREETIIGPDGKIIAEGKTMIKEKEK